MSDLLDAEARPIEELDARNAHLGLRGGCQVTCISTVTLALLQKGLIKILSPIFLGGRKLKLSSIIIKNFRSIKDSGEIFLNSIQAFVGENNTGKSSILLSIEALCSAGAGKITHESFNEIDQPLVIRGVFTDLKPHEKRRWKPYLVEDKLILEKHYFIENDERSSKSTVKTEFHGYKAEPKEWYLSIEKIMDKEGSRPNWLNIVESNGLPDYFIQDGTCNKSIFSKALERYLLENEVEYDKPDLSSTQALGLQSNVISSLPSVHILSAICDYNDEIDKRASSTTFRKLVADLSERILQTDPKYIQIQEAIETINAMFNEAAPGSELQRLDSLSAIEEAIGNIIKRLMPSVRKLKISVEMEEIKDIFSKGINITVDDGVLTDVVLKGHGLQRCIIFSLLQALILNQRNCLLSKTEPSVDSPKTIILLIEEPELYIHPQMQKLFYDVMVEFSNTDQVIYTTHSPLMIDTYKYECISIVRKDNIEIGTKVNNCNKSAFEGLTEKGIFKGITMLNSSVNELFFAKKVLLVEGPEDKIAVTETFKKIGIIEQRTEEIDLSIIVAGGKQSIKFFQRILNAFKIPYVVLHDNDLYDGMNADNRAMQTKLNEEIMNLAGANKVIKFPIKLENTVGVEKGHFQDQYDTLKFFMDPNNINKELESIVKDIVQ